MKEPTRNFELKLGSLQQRHGACPGRHTVRMSGTQCFEWYRCFKSKRTSLEDDECPGRLTTCISPRNVGKIHQLSDEDSQRTINEITDAVGFFLYGSVKATVTSKLNMQRFSAECVSRLLTTQHKEHRVDVCQHLRHCTADGSSFLSRIITV